MAADRRKILDAAHQAATKAVHDFGNIMTALDQWIDATNESDLLILAMMCETMTDVSKRMVERIREIQNAAVVSK